MKKTISGLALALGVGGCASETTNPPAKMTAAEVEASIAKSMERLQALQVFSASQLILDLPAEATSCYGVPCDDTWRPAYEAERARQAPRLAGLADLTEQISHDASLQPLSGYDTGAAVQALEALQIV